MTRGDNFGSGPLREDTSLRRLGSGMGKTETSPYVQRCHSTHSAGFGRAVTSTVTYQSALECFSGIISRHNEIDKQVRHALQVFGNAPRLKMDEEFPGQRFVGKMKPTVQVLEAFRGLLLGLCRTGVLTDVKISQSTRVAHDGGKPNFGLPGGPVR